MEMGITPAHEDLQHAGRISNGQGVNREHATTDHWANAKGDAKVLDLRRRRRQNPLNRSVSASKGQPESACGWFYAPGIGT